MGINYPTKGGTVQFPNSIILPKPGFALKKLPGPILITQLVVPNDGKDHLVICGFRKNCTVENTGGAVEFIVEDPFGVEAGRFTIFTADNPGNKTSSRENFTQYVGPGSTLKLIQETELLTGAATITAEILAT